MTGKPNVPNVPEGWRVVRLGDVAEVNPRRSRLSMSDDIPVTFLPMAAISEGLQGILVRELRPYSEVSTGYTYFEEDDFLFAKITPCLQNGKHALATGLKEGFGFGTTEFHVVRASSGLTAPFMSRVLTQAHVIDRCAQSFTGTAGQQRVQPETLKALPVLLPPIPEQRAIAAVLDAIDDAIGGAEAVIAATGQLRDSLLHQLLTRGVPGWHTAWKEGPGLGTIPADWEVVNLGEVVPKFEYGTSTRCLSEPAGVPVLRIPNIASGELDLSGLKYANLSSIESAKLQVTLGDILLVRTNGNPDVCGQCWVAEELEGEWAFASYLVRGRPDQSVINPWFIGHFLKSAAGRRMLQGHIRTSAGNYNLSVGDLGSMPIPCPNLNEQKTMVDAVASITLAIEQVRRERDTLQSLKESTADALLTGRVRISP